MWWTHTHDPLARNIVDIEQMVLDDSRLGESLEIYDCVPVGDADLMDDSSLPGS